MFSYIEGKCSTFSLNLKHHMHSYGNHLSIITGRLSNGFNLKGDPNFSHLSNKLPPKIFDKIAGIPLKNIQIAWILFKNFYILEGNLKISHYLCSSLYMKEEFDQSKPLKQVHRYPNKLNTNSSMIHNGIMSKRPVTIV